MASTDTAKVTRGKKGDGPLAISYLANDKALKRVEDGVTHVVVTSKSGAVKNYDLSAIPHPILLQLAGMGLGKRMDVFARNTVKNSDDANVIELTDKVYSDVVGGKIYTRAEGSGAGAGRPFNYEIWQEIAAETAKRKKAPAPTEAQLKAFKNKLESFTPADRQKFIRKLQLDKVFALASKVIHAKHDADKLKKDGIADDAPDALADMF